MTLTAWVLEVSRDKLFPGDFKNALSHDDNIIKFASGNPKDNGFLECKVFGMSLNSEVSKQWSYQVPTTELPGRHSRLIRIIGQ